MKKELIKQELTTSDAGKLQWVETYDWRPQVVDCAYLMAAYSSLYILTKSPDYGYFWSAMDSTDTYTSVDDAHTTYWKSASEAIKAALANDNKVKAVNPRNVFCDAFKLFGDAARLTH